MFESGVVKESALAVESNGNQQNGAILGKGCALFLAKFTATLIIKYNEEIIEEGLDLVEIDQASYGKALSSALMELAHEDMAQHGRLLCMKEVLTDLAASGELTMEQNAMFYIKDIDALRGGEGETNVEEVFENPPAEEEILQIIEKREADKQFRATGMFNLGNVAIGEELEGIRDALINKQGLVPDDQIETLREQLKESFNDNLIYALKKSNTELSDMSLSDITGDTAAQSKEDEDEEENEDDDEECKTD